MTHLFSSEKRKTQHFLKTRWVSFYIPILLGLEKSIPISLGLRFHPNSAGFRYLLFYPKNDGVIFFYLFIPILLGLRVHPKNVRVIPFKSFHPNFVRFRNTHPKNVRFNFSKLFHPNFVRFKNFTPKTLGFNFTLIFNKNVRPMSLSQFR